MLKIKNRFGKEISNDNSNREDYVLEYTNPNDYISDYGIEDYEALKDWFNTTENLDAVCIYVQYIKDERGVEYDYTERTGCMSGLINGKWYMLYDDVTELEMDNINDVHKYVFDWYYNS